MYQLKIAVIGATGVLGRQVIPRLIERGHHVRAIVHRSYQAERLRQMEVEAAIGDILQPDTLLPSTENCEAALHLATAIPKDGQEQDWSMNNRIRREGTQNFIRACQTNGIRRYVQQSITLVYGDQGTNIVDEDGTVKPKPITQSAIDMESHVQAADLDWCILRGGLFYGDDTGRNKAWQQAAAAGTLRIPGDGKALISLIHVVDMARAIVLAVERAPAHSIYNVVDDLPVDYHTLFQYIAALAGGREPELGGDPFLPSLGCTNALIKKELDWKPIFATYRTGLVN